MLIGQCSSGTLDLGHHGQARLVIGMVYLDEKNYWVFFVKSVSVHGAKTMTILFWTIKKEGAVVWIEVIQK